MTGEVRMVAIDAAEGRGSIGFAHSALLPGALRPIEATTQVPEALLAGAGIGLNGQNLWWQQCSGDWSVEVVVVVVVVVAVGEGVVEW
eukprot:CAMPEP_0119544610 /NCGR_PEP_ID=MMETSP1344-20130328/54818_1 /TAXON_ID=236787 /ORGANISM="Florenciella parvula, Strain CCMP2471" /LENGTH=87 /DNA_ID=CAMNT_0007589113 /DNA_START=382 /DNA_END=647 /DNA_ORIENTATION=+